MQLTCERKSSGLVTHWVNISFCFQQSITTANHQVVNFDRLQVLWKATSTSTLPHTSKKKKKAPANAGKS